MAAFRMWRIPVPEWAPNHLVRGADGETLPDLTEDGGVEAYAVLAARHDALLALVDQAINDFVNNDVRAFDGWEEFPSRQRLTGEYYLERRYYSVKREGHFFASIMAHCLEKPWYPKQVEQDYLGLDVDVEFDQHTGLMAVAMLSSSVI